MTTPIYLDHNATCPIDPDVLEAMLPYMKGDFGNPSSIHRFGQQAKRGIDTAREQVAAFIGADPEEIIFTSGGTESDNMAILGGFAALRDSSAQVVVSPIEHQAVLGPVAHLEEQGVGIHRLTVHPSGEVDTTSLPSAVTGKALISVMLVNNDTGVVQPIPELSNWAKEQGAVLHTDAVQGAGKIPVNVSELGVNLMSISAHKLYGPKGIGALFVKRGTRIFPNLFGGHQEMKRRAGTENVAAIVGLGKACELALHRLADDIGYVTSLRDRLITGIEASLEDVIVFGKAAPRVCNTVNVGFGGLEGDTLLMALDLKGVAVSTGSACLSESNTPSHVLTAMGVGPKMTQGSIRFSLGRHNTISEIDTVIEMLKEWVPKLR